jgi:hypothetical protein
MNDTVEERGKRFIMCNKQQIVQRKELNNHAQVCLINTNKHAIPKLAISDA